MIGCSAAYNLVPQHRPSKQILRRLDHAAIFIMIAGTYTPFAVNRLDAPSGTVILALIWAAATFGVVMKLLYPRRFEIASLALYLGMGWMIVTVIVPLAHTMARARFLAAGGGRPRLFRRRGVLCDRAHPLSQGDLARRRPRRRRAAIHRDSVGVRRLIA